MHSLFIALAVVLPWQMGRLDAISTICGNGNLRRRNLFQSTDTIANVFHFNAPTGEENQESTDRWNSILEDCKEELYDVGFFLDQHVYGMALPVNTNTSCPTMALHDSPVLRDTFQRKEIIEFQQDRLHVDPEELCLMGFELPWSEIADAFEHAQLPSHSEVGYETVIQNCASLPIHAFQLLGLYVDEYIVRCTAGKMDSYGIVPAWIKESPYLPAVESHNVSWEHVNENPVTLMERFVDMYVSSFHRQTQPEENFNQATKSLMKRRLQGHRNLVGDTQPCDVCVYADNIEEGVTNVVGLFQCYDAAQSKFVLTAGSSTDGPATISQSFFYTAEQYETSVVDIGPLFLSRFEVVIPRPFCYSTTKTFLEITTAVETNFGTIDGAFDLEQRNGAEHVLRVIEALGLNIDDQAMKNYLQIQLVDNKYAVKIDPTGMLLFNGDLSQPTDEALVMTLIEYTISRFSNCGNGIIEVGEACDDGANNGVEGQKCNQFCAFVDSWYCPPGFNVPARPYECMVDQSEGLCDEDCARDKCETQGLGEFLAPDTCVYQPCPWARGYIQIESEKCVMKPVPGVCDGECAGLLCNSQGGTIFKNDPFYECTYIPCPYETDFQYNALRSTTHADKIIAIDDRFDSCYANWRSSCGKGCFEERCTRSGGTNFAPLVPNPADYTQMVPWEAWNAFTCLYERPNWSPGGSGCTVVETETGATINCDDTTTATIKDGVDGVAGVDGIDGVNGVDGSSCTASYDGTSATITCGDSPTTTIMPSCTVEENIFDGSATISCGDGTTATITQGADGSSCTVTDAGEISTITCDDGTSATVNDGVGAEALTKALTTDIDCAVQLQVMLSTNALVIFLKSCGVCADLIHWRLERIGISRADAEKCVKHAYGDDTTVSFQWRERTSWFVTCDP